MKKILMLSSILMLSPYFIAEANAVDKSLMKGKTALMSAAEKNNIAEIERLISLGENVNYIDYSFNNAYCYAYLNNNKKIMTILEQAGSKADNTCFIDGLYFSTKSVGAAPKIIETSVAEAEATRVDNYYNSFETGIMDALTSSTAMYALGTAAVVGAVAAAAGGGGGGGSAVVNTPYVQDPTVESDTGGGNPTVYETTEFYGDYAFLGLTSNDISPALDIIGAQNSYARGHAGQGVTIGVLDTGIDLDNSQFEGNIYSDLSNTNQQGIYDNDGQDINDPTHQVGDNNHGTKVAGVIAAVKNDTIMHGVAYNSKIIPYRMGVTGDPSGINNTRTDEAILDGINKGAFIFNLSFGEDADAINNATTADQDFLEGSTTGWYVVGSGVTQYMTDLITAVTTGNEGKGSIIVKSAGNEGYSQSGRASALPMIFQDMQGYFINAVALDKAGTALASFSNACGVTKDYCLAAPGSSIITTNEGEGSYSLVNGTSFATPTISGAAAVIKSFFPYLSAPEVTSLMFRTADDLGDPGVDDIYGQGRLNLDAATTPGVGPASVMISGGKSVSLGGTGVSTSSAFGSFKINDFVMTDDLNRTFQLNGSALKREAEDAFDVLESAKNFAEPKNVIRTSSFDGDFSTSFTMGRDEDKEYELAGLEEMKFTSNYGEDSQISFGYTETPGRENLAGVESSMLLRNDVSDHPFLSLASEGTTTSMSHEITDNLTLENNVLFGELKDDNDKDLGSVVTSSVKLNYEMDNSSLGLEVGMMNESDTMLGAKLEGAFALGGNNTTYFSGLSGTANFTNKLRGFANAHIGWTDVNTVSNSLVSNVDTLVSHSANAGIEYNLTSNKKTGFVLSQPLRVSNGSMDYGMATSRNIDSSYNFSNFSQSLSTGGTEFDIQAFYQHDIYENTKMNFGAVHRFNANNVDGENETAVMFKIKHSY